MTRLKSVSEEIQSSLSKDCISTTIKTHRKGVNSVFSLINPKLQLVDINNEVTNCKLCFCMKRLLFVLGRIQPMYTLDT